MYKSLYFILIFIVALYVHTICAAERLVLLEQFTNVDGEFCALSNPRIDRVINEFSGRTIAIKYHVWWPKVDDPLYVAFGLNSAIQRTSYYNVTQLPEVYIDGQGVRIESPLQRGYRDISTSIQTRLEQTSPIGIVPRLDTLGISIDSTDSLRLSAVVSNEQSNPLDNLTIHFVVVEDNIEFDNSPGIHGERLFKNVVRRMFPDADGQSFSLAAGANQEFSHTFNRPFSWIGENIFGVIFVQNSENEVLQAATTRRQFGLVAENSHLTVEAGQTGELSCQLVNYTSQPDTYQVSLTSGIPDTWNSTWSINDATVGDSATIAVDANTAIEMSISIETSDQGGEARFLIEAFPFSDSAQVVRKELVVFSNVSVLLVDDDGFLEHETYYESILDTMGHAVARWQPDLESLSIDQLKDINALFWWTGWANPSLDSLDQDFLRKYLDGGGNLFISGQDIGWDLCDDSTGSLSSQDSKDFYETYLHARYLTDNSKSMQIFGEMGDPVAQGLSFSIANGDGANNQYYPSIIDTIPPAELSFTYGSLCDSCENVAGIRAIHDSTLGNKVVYLAFGFEAIDSKEKQKTLLENVLSWFGLLSTGVERTELLIHSPRQEFRLYQNYPNPFNPKTTITFDVVKSCRVRLSVFNTIGQKVTTLTDKEYAVGKYEVIFNGQDLPSGVYLFTIRMRDFVDAKRAVLLK